MAQITYGDVSWERMIRAVENVRNRLKRVVETLEKSGIAYAVIGGNAVAAWVSRADEAAVRNTRDVDILLRRSDFEAAKRTLAEVGFIYRHVKSIDMFLDGPRAKARDAVHVIFAAEKVRPEDVCPAPDVTESEKTLTGQLLNLEPLVRMKLEAFRPKDQMHLVDLIDVELVDRSWCHRFPAELARRLQQAIDTAER
jgi:hypothetical protein